jgi:hypothetical protein
MGLYGVHGNVQRESLWQVEESKAFVKAVKPNNAAIALYLWNNWVNMLGINKETKDKALSGLRQLGF